MRFNHTARAMTLVEVLVASVILGVGVAGLMSAASLSMRNQQRAEQRATALYLAQEKLAEVELYGAHVSMLARPLRGTADLGPVTYAWTLDIEQQQVGELFIVQVEVEWPGGSVVLETWLNDYEAKEAANRSHAPPAGGNPGNNPAAP